MLIFPAAIPAAIASFPRSGRELELEEEDEDEDELVDEDDILVGESYN